MTKTVGATRNLAYRTLDALRAVRSCRRPATKTAVTALSLTAAGILVVSGLISPTTSRAKGDDGFTTFTVEVAQQAKTNVQNDVDPLEGQDVFTRGDTYILDGPIYPNGSIPIGHNVDPDPHARIIGRYRTRGTFTGGPGTVPIAAFASELFSLPNDLTTILTDGICPSEEFSAYRVVLGGTGRYRGSGGEAYQENIGTTRQVSAICA
ncbi:MAG: hypothetical protein ACR2IV_16735 [Bryobacteraceae bacterium]